MAIYSIKDLNFSYPEEEKIALKNIKLEINKGEFVVLCGASGSGKTTLLRHLKPALTPHGVKTGEILFKDRSLEELTMREQSARIGFVMQSPENQIVTDKVWHELAFGLESLGYDSATIRLRVAEMASFFGIQNWFHKNVNELSGGQKQLLNLAGIMTMQPSVLILDEPTSQLDPIAAADFLASLQKINQELGTSILLSEHRLEEAMPLADRVIVMDQGEVIADDTPKKLGRQLREMNHSMFQAMPSPMRIHAGVKNALELPMTVREGRIWLDTLVDKGLETKNKLNKKERSNNQEVALEIEDAWFKYEENLPDIIKGLSLEVKKGEFLAIMGGNGTGKTTMLSLLSAINVPYRGKVSIKRKDLANIPANERFNKLIGVLPQNPQTLFVKKTVQEDLEEMLKEEKITEKEKEFKIQKVSYLCDLNDLLSRHPYDLSGGEQQRAALAKVLLLEPQILLLDEPTKGLDAEFKQQFADILKNLIELDVTIVMVSHDIEFSAEHASRCALFFDGDIVTEGTPEEFFAGNNFYTTAANRMVRHQIADAVTVEDVILSCGGEVTKKTKIDFDKNLFEKKFKKRKDKNTKVKNKWYKNKGLGFISLILMILIAIKGFPLISEFAWSSYTGASESIDLIEPATQWKYLAMIFVFIASGLLVFFSFFEKDKKIPESPIQLARGQRKLTKRTILASLLILLLIPFTIFIGLYYLGDRKYYFISLLIILEVMIPFMMVFEGRDPKARELVIISVLSAIGVAGRAAFFMVPQFKPVAAIVIVSGIAFGAESGFLVGAVTMFLSNILYGQGPLTPWQMFAMGIIGFLAGLFFKKGFLRRNKISLALFGGVSVFLIYGLIMNTASVLVWQAKVNWQMIATSLVVGVPFDLIHGGATFFFLMIIGEPMLEKLDRIKVKYGLI